MVDVIEHTCIGSSPLARGLHDRLCRDGYRGGIIPARAGFTGVRHNRSFWIPDHPRSRGVYTPAASATARLFGSSPLARGLLLVFALVRCVGGIIPARAGFTKVERALRTYREDHPRSRGVYLFSDRVGHWCSGSSPLARGLPLLRGRRRSQQGIIPARAGFTTATRTSRGSTRDHPRSRGVYCVLGLLRLESAGSSPLARGLPNGLPALTTSYGIIPARAGFTKSALLTLRILPDHPRSRGVYSSPFIVLLTAVGSSPLARGLLKYLSDRLAEAGIIPARAGFTCPGPRGAGGRRDHPRSRGVYQLEWEEMSPAQGSSPLARGLRRDSDHGYRTDWIIPARAGFTARRRPSRSAPADHPRSRGVYVVDDRGRGPRPGSSPLARGLRGCGCVWCVDSGIIPARAGFTVVTLTPP